MPMNDLLSEVLWEYLQSQLPVGTGRSLFMNRRGPGYSSPPFGWLRLPARWGTPQPYHRRAREQESGAQSKPLTTLHGANHYGNLMVRFFRRRGCPSPISVKSNSGEQRFEKHQPGSLRSTEE
jgi:hypothetical protein